ncbi:MAG: hypothetical protein ACXW20_06025 [Burkholderiales bacterium]
MILSGFCGKPLEPAALVTCGCASAALEKQTSMSAVRFKFAMNHPEFRDWSADRLRMCAPNPSAKSAAIATVDPIVYNGILAGQRHN